MGTTTDKLSRLMRLMDQNDVIQRRAGIVWKNLKVCGSGSAINIQKNVGSLLLSPLRFGEFFGKGLEKTILNQFDGVLKSGEMLVVLGRPGSGCSTLLKTLMGELHGLDMKSQSEIHYNGTPFLPSLLKSDPENFLDFLHRLICDFILC
jgi:ATP-binding cassette, subfamily G (WHITE), member 2, PDR